MDRSTRRRQDQAREDEGAENGIGGDDAADLAVPPTRRSGVYETLRPPPPGPPEPAPSPGPPEPAPSMVEDAHATFTRFYKEHRGFVAERLQDKAPRSWERIHQEVFLTVYTQLRETREVPRDPRAYLTTLIKNQAGNHKAYHGRRRGHRSADDIEICASQPTPEEHAIHDERQHILAEALDELSPAERELIEDVDLDGEAPEETAEKLGISHQTLRKRLGRARDRFAEIVRRRLGLPGGGHR